jgi:proteasome lid subunit RPN8/RPN11
VGDWHSHPEPVPRPSYLDLHSMKECFLRSKHELRNFLLIIVGNRAGPAGLYVALVSNEIVKLDQEPQEITSYRKRKIRDRVRSCLLLAPNVRRDIVEQTTV